MIKLNPKNVLALKNKGNSMNKLKKYKEAIDCFNKLIYLKPKDYLPYF